MRLQGQVVVYTFAILVSFTKVVFARPFEGFKRVNDITEFTAATQAKLEQGTFKIQIGSADTHGTSYLINSSGYMLTNVHNVKSCLDEHGLAKTGYDGEQGEVDCKILTLKNFKGEELGPLKLIASHPYYPASGLRIEVAIIKSVAPQVLSQAPLQISEEPVPAAALFAVGFPGATSRSVRAISKQIRNLNRILKLSAELETEIELADPTKLSAHEMVTIYMHFISAATPLTGGSNELSRLLFPEKLSQWFSMKPNEVKAAIVETHGKIRPQFYAYVKMLETALNSQYRKGYVKSYPDADNDLKVTSEITRDERLPGIWLLRGEGRPGSSGSPVVDSSGVVHGILFSTALVSNEMRYGCTADIEFSNWESAKYTACRNSAILMVGSELIRSSLKKWRIDLK